jgi:hypothetical protein
VQDLSATATTAYVDDAGALTQPDLINGVFGLCTIDGERIMYRDRDLAANAITGCIRGTAGTGAAAHTAGTDVYDIGRGNLLYAEYQDYIVKDTALGDGSTTIFYAPSIDIDNPDESSSIDIRAIEVYVGGQRQYAYSDTSATSQYRWIVAEFDPLAIEFITDYAAVPPLTAPASGVEVTVLVRRGQSWYQPGAVEPSDGVALQETQTLAARFFRGL